MTITIRDQADVDALSHVVGTDVEVYGPDGQLLGRFVPAPRPGMTFPEIGLTDAEMDRRLNDPHATWVSGDDVLARLRSLRDTK